ncbi:MULTISPECIES: septum formation initiator family protein [Paenibacillus]|uniref:Septum formation initiator family protein n=2 Tax=Paenibacillus TaxID=44249 RepID=A0ABU6DIZ6_9BACL|nr:MULTISPECIES: septum formation initiator family protein [Paenibacillus]MBA2940989.1 septum formation initiator family protein [Paenibacillus sp. CGMCC 1.16610]MCY9662801.1 septum formation initiator family protein [Paenibacillus anseongense]MEB4796787.1 septum formation initiator family protein [Paenibacillus chondroitinus]MVQ38835.1 septum formation initiator family protein [Paenibacillus anseongense]
MQAQATAPNKRSSSVGSKRRLRFLMIFVLCFMSWAAVNIWGQFAKLHEKRNAVANMEQQLVDAKKIKEQTQKEISRLHNDEYLDQIIRRDFHYSKTGETPLSVSKQ